MSEALDIVSSIMNNGKVSHSDWVKLKILDQLIQMMEQQISELKADAAQLRSDKRECDHKNRNPLDNRRANIRICTHQENLFNQTKQVSYGGKPCSSKYLGVFWDKEKKKWRASITLNRKGYNLGRFSSELAAAERYNEAAQELFGEFANLNDLSEKRAANV